MACATLPPKVVNARPAATAEMISEQLRFSVDLSFTITRLPYILFLMRKLSQIRKSDVHLEAGHIGGSAFVVRVGTVAATVGGDNRDQRGQNDQRAQHLCVKRGHLFSTSHPLRLILQAKLLWVEADKLGRKPAALDAQRAKQGLINRKQLYLTNKWKKIVDCSTFKQRRSELKPTNGRRNLPREENATPSLTARDIPSILVSLIAAIQRAIF